MCAAATSCFWGDPAQRNAQSFGAERSCLEPAAEGLLVPRGEKSGEGRGGAGGGEGEGTETYCDHHVLLFLMIIFN